MSTRTNRPASAAEQITAFVVGAILAGYALVFAFEGFGSYLA